MLVKRYEDGTFKVQQEELDKTNLADRNGIELIWDLLNDISLDFDLAGDAGCASNYEMYYPLYNAYTGLMYLVLDRELDAYHRGEEVTLYGYVPSDEEMAAYYAERE